MIDRVPQWFEIGMLIDHRRAQISVTHYVTNERWILRLCHRVRAEGMPRVIEYFPSWTNLVSRSFSCRASHARISSILPRTSVARR